MDRRVTMCVIGWAAAARVASAGQPDGPSIRVVETEQGPGPRERPPDEPILRFDPSVRVAIERLAEHTTQLQLTQRAELHITGAWRDDDDDERLRQGDSLTQAWRASVGASYKFDWGSVGAHASYEALQTELAGGRVIDLGIGVQRTFRVSKNVTGFAGFSLSERRWLGKPPPGEGNARTFLMSAGLRWR